MVCQKGNFNGFEIRVRKTPVDDIVSQLFERLDALIHAFAPHPTAIEARGAPWRATRLPPLEVIDEQKALTRDRRWKTKVTQRRVSLAGQ